jgi:hypothetical protein
MTCFRSQSTGQHASVVPTMNPIEDLSNTERILNTPQGSMVSDIHQTNDSSDDDKNIDVEHDDIRPELINNDPSIINELNNLKLDTDKVNSNVDRRLSFRSRMTTSTVNSCICYTGTKPEWACVISSRYYRSCLETYRQ